MAIISKADYTLAQKKFVTRQHRKNHGNLCILYSKVFCAECKRRCTVSFSTKNDIKRMYARCDANKSSLNQNCSSTYWVNLAHLNYYCFGKPFKIYEEEQEDITL